MQIEGNLVDVIKGEIYPARIIFDSKIQEIIPIEKAEDFILPGFIDSHIHIESSMLCPSRFSEAVVPHGTAAVVSDPHEIANVLGLKGVEFMIEDSKWCPLKVFFTAPSCVPATGFETSGAVLGVKEIEELLKRKEIVALGEMMNFPGVINGDKTVMRKIEIAKKYGKPIDGHCPCLSGEDLKKYISTGITTEHECLTLKEAEEKASLGMKIMIREGSSAKNMENLIGLKNAFAFVSDDVHSEDLQKGHINLILRKAVSLGKDPIEAIRMVTLNPSEHYKLNMGIEKGKMADLVIVDSLKEFNVKKVFIDGVKVVENGKKLFEIEPKTIETNMNISEKIAKDFEVISDKEKILVNVIGVVEGQLFTKHLKEELGVKENLVQNDFGNDILKIAVVERYGGGNIGIGFIKGFGLKKGAIASSIAHDSHNILVVGTNDKDMAKAVNTVAEKGGIAVVGGDIHYLELPIAGLMTDEDVEHVAGKLRELDENVKRLGCKLKSAFTTLSFMALPVIPELKLTDKGLFDVQKFGFVDLEV